MSPPLVRRAGHVSLNINRSRLAIFHVFDDSEILQSYIAVLVPLLSRWRGTPSGQLELLVMFSFLFLSFFGLGLSVPLFHGLSQLC